MAPVKGCDSFGAVTGAACQAAGISFACRYLWATGPGQKGATAAEAADLRAHGILLVLNYEGGALDYQGGYSGGQAAAKAANAYADALGAPAGAWIWYSLDTNLTAQNATPYFQGIASIGGRPVGVYGGEAGKGIWLAGLAEGWWQAMATSWSLTYPDPGALIVQGGTGTVGGTQVDFNQAQSPFFGAWGQEAATFMALSDDQQTQLYNWVEGLVATTKATDAAKDPGGNPMTDHATIGWIWGYVEKLAAVQPPAGSALSDADVQRIAVAVAPAVIAALKAAPLMPTSAA